MLKVTAPEIFSYLVYCPERNLSRLPPPEYYFLYFLPFDNSYLHYLKYNLLSENIYLENPCFLCDITKDLIEDRHNGFLIPMHDEAMFAEKICTLIEDEEMRKRMRHQAWLASLDYQLDKIITRWMRLFEGLRAEKKSC